jgi:arabinose-5-phosphate isomerase
MPAMSADDPISDVCHVLRQEGQAVLGLAASMADQAGVVRAVVDLIAVRTGDGRPGRLITTGVGKAGIIARKIAATCSSTGTPSAFLHPAEARHGDLGLVQAADVVLALSNSGSSEELVALLPSLRLAGTPVVALVGRADSPLGRHADQCLTIGAVIEACPLGLAPSTSTTALLALGDALALAVQRRRRFTPEQYARFHPGGALGRSLMTCREAMRTGDRVAAVISTTSVAASIAAITAARAGSAVIVDEQRRLLGIFTDGDLRRAIGRAADPGAILAQEVARHATIPCRFVSAGELLQSAMRQCSERKINELPVVDDGVLVGLLDLQDLTERGHLLDR